MMFSFNSTGAKFDGSMMGNKGPPKIRIQGHTIVIREMVEVVSRIAVEPFHCHNIVGILGL